MRIISAISQKGGVGKTTVTATLAAAMAADGFRVLLLDMNDQGDLSDTMGTSTEGDGVLELLEGKPVLQMIRKTNTDRVDIITGGERLAMIETKIKAQGQGRALLLREALRPVRRMYQYCIIDAPGTFGSGMLNALGASDSVIIPAQPDFYSIKGINRIIKNIRYVKKEINPGLRVDGILLNRYQGRRLLTRDITEVLQEAEKALGCSLFQAKIRENSKIAEAPGRRDVILHYAPNSIGAEDFRAFYDEYMGILRKGTEK